MSYSPLTVEEVQAAVEHPNGEYWIHRHAGEHGVNDDCWCSPVRLTGWQIMSMSHAEMQQWLEDHFKVH